MSKKSIMLVLVAVLVLVMFVPSNKVLAVNNKKVISVNVKQENEELIVDGEVEEGMLAVAVQVYNQDNQLVKLKTGEVDSNNKYEVTFTLPKASYIIKVADFDGGEVVTKEPIEEEQNDGQEETENNEENKNNNVSENTNSDENEEKKSTNPVTGDNIVRTIIVFSIATLGVFTILRIKKNNKK